MIKNKIQGPEIPKFRDFWIGYFSFLNPNSAIRNQKTRITQPATRNS